MAVELTIEELREAKDVDLGASDWIEITQERIDGFADATDDHQWIHVDPEKAEEGPFGTTIAHGYLTISLLPVMVTSIVNVTGVQMGVNYGIDRMRLTAPVKVGSRVRAKGRLVEAQDKGGGVLYKVAVEVEIDGEDRPALVGEVLYLVYG
ncbi:MAG: MaoC family dehydratase [Actinobacteria bacterium]|nr:MaoC family dehydratase [Actinomycetota bacterium]